MFDLSGKCALVTGASGGIGGAISRALYGQGASVALSGTRAQALDELASELGSGTYVIPANLGEAGAARVSASFDFEDAIGRLAAKFGL